MTTAGIFPVLLVADERQTLDSSESVLRCAGIRDIRVVDDSSQVFPTLEKGDIGVIVLDLLMNNVSGRDLLLAICRDYQQIPTIVMTETDEIDTVIDCMRSGAFDYLVKPVENSRLVSSVKKALEICTLKNEVAQLSEHLRTNRIRRPEAFSRIITASPKMLTAFQYCEVMAESRQAVIIIGETGVGKELVAQAIHELSGLQGMFVPVNIAGLDDNMFSDTLFGHKKGAFTGAEKARSGLIAQATGGTLFLDEIGDLAEVSQVKLLRLLQEQEYYPVGSDTPLLSDARIVAATNRDLREMTASKKFRNDLYFRLCSHQVLIPPLRERLEDIPLLLEFFLKAAAQIFRRSTPGYPHELVTLLSSYDFPGNVRELKSMVFDAVARHVSGVLSLERFREVIGSMPTPAGHASHLSQRLNDWLLGSQGRFPKVREVEELLIDEAMKLAQGNQGIAASLLGFTRQTLHKRLKARKEKG